MNSNGSAADWALGGSHKLSATLRVVSVTNSPSGGQTTHTVGHMSIGKTWTYTIAVSGGNTIDLTVNGSTTHYAIPSSFKPYKQYFKAGSYNQSSSDSTTNGAKVKFYSLTITHS